MPDRQFVRFTAVYAAAVLDYLATGVNRAIEYDQASHDFESSEVESGTSPTDVGVWIGSTWQQIVGDLDVPVDPTDPMYSAKALEEAIITALEQSPSARTLVDALILGEY